MKVSPMSADRRQALQDIVLVYGLFTLIVTIVGAASLGLPLAYEYLQQRRAARADHFRHNQLIDHTGGPWLVRAVLAVETGRPARLRQRAEQS